jgi:hypothetical protein
METKCIKNVDEETWKKFKAMSVEYNMNMSELLKNMINEQKKKVKKDNKRFWNEILNHKKTLDENEAKVMEEFTRKLREERGFRDVSF